MAFTFYLDAIPSHLAVSTKLMTTHFNRRLFGVFGVQPGNGFDNAYWALRRVTTTSGVHSFHFLFSAAGNPSIL